MTPLIDAHAHVFTRSLPAAPGARYRPDYDALLTDWQSQWPLSNVSAGVLVQPSFLGTDNNYLLRMLATNTKRLRGVVVVDAEAGEVPIEVWHAAGVRGVRLNLVGEDTVARYISPAWRSLYDAMALQGWHLEIQCEGERFAPAVDALGALVPDLAWVIDHMGLPDPQYGVRCSGLTALREAASHREIYVKISAPYRLRGVDTAKLIAWWQEGLGVNRLLWGSDWPWTNYESGREYSERVPGLQGRILAACGANAALLYGFAPEHLPMVGIA